MDNYLDGTTLIRTSWASPHKEPYTLAKRIKADTNCGKHFQSSERKTYRLLMGSDQSLIGQSHREQRNQFR
jgi:hypothetical protein